MKGQFDLCAISYQSKDEQELYVLRMYCLTYAGH